MSTEAPDERGAPSGAAPAPSVEAGASPARTAGRPARRWAGFALVLVAVAAIGFWAGREIRQWRTGSASEATIAAPPPPAFGAGDPFPQVMLVAAGGERVSTGELLDGHGAAVLFLKPSCPACGESVQVWQSWIEAGELTADQVLGISSSPPQSLAEYRRTQGLTFPIYHDADAVFFRDLGVSAVPLTTFVDSTGSIRRVGFEPPGALDPGEVAAAVE